MRLGRPRQFDSDIALDAAMQIFWRNGYEATTLHDLLDGMGLSKSSLYQEFGNKHDLFVQCVELYRQRTVADMMKRLQRARSARSFLSASLRAVLSERRGCLVVNTATEFAQSDKAVANCVTVALDDYRRVFEAAVEKGQEDGSIRADLRSSDIAAFLLTNLTGIRTLVKAGTEQRMLSRVVEFVMDTIK